MTGYTTKTLERKIESGVWIQGVHYRIAPDGHRLIDLESFEKWVENKPAVFLRETKSSGSSSFDKAGAQAKHSTASAP